LNADVEPLAAASAAGAGIGDGAPADGGDGIGAAEGGDGAPAAGVASPLGVPLGADSEANADRALPPEGAATDSADFGAFAAPHPTINPTITAIPSVRMPVSTQGKAGPYTADHAITRSRDAEHPPHHVLGHA
jgi:hypothetical protein